MDLIFRKGTLDDKDKLQALGILSYSQHQSSMTLENWNKFSSFMSNPDTFKNLMSTLTCFLCGYENEIIGMAFLISNGHPTEIFEGQRSYIRMVGVNPNFEGKGIAKKLTQKCIDYAKEINENYVDYIHQNL